MQVDRCAIEQVMRTGAQFADRCFADNVLDIDHAGEGLSKRTLDEGIEAGFHNVVLPENAGGGGFDMPELCALVSTLAERCAGHAMVFGIQAAVLRSLNDTLGTDTALSVSRLLPDGAPIGVCLCEPDGDEGFETGLSVVCDRDEVKLAGSPGVAVNGGAAGHVLAFARQPHGAPTALLIDGRQVTCESHQTLGLRAMAMTTLQFDGETAPDARHLADGETVTLLYRNLARNLCLVCASAAAGLMTKAHAVAFEYAAQRYQGGSMIIEHSHLAELLGHMQAQVATAGAAAPTASESADDALAIATKIRVSSAAAEVCTDAVQVLGGYGYMRGFGLEKAMRDAAVLSLIPFSNCRASLLLTDIEKRRLAGG